MSITAVQAFEKTRTYFDEIKHLSSFGDTIVFLAENIPLIELPDALENLWQNEGEWQKGEWQNDAKDYLRPSSGREKTFHLWFDSGYIRLFCGFCFEGKPDKALLPVLQWRANKENKTVDELITEISISV